MVRPRTLEAKKEEVKPRPSRKRSSTLPLLDSSSSPCFKRGKKSDEVAAALAQYPAPNVWQCSNIKLITRNDPVKSKAGHEFISTITLQIGVEGNTIKMEDGNSSNEVTDGYKPTGHDVVYIEIE